MTVAAVGIDLVLEQLARAGHPARKSGAGWAARCPAHDDNNPSLSITVGDDQPVIFTCHTGCDSERILAALGLTWQDVCREPERREKFDIVATYPYADEDGNILFQVCRLHPKSFRQQRPNGAGGWTWGLADTRRVLYRLPSVLFAAASGQPVYVVEGEKDADRVAALGATATCNPMGAGKWRAEHTETLRGAHVVLVADADDAGRAHALHVARSVAPVAASLICCEPAAGKDVSDHLAAGLDLDALTVVDPATWAKAEPQPDVDPSDWLASTTPASTLDVDLLTDTPDEPPAASEIDRLRAALLTGVDVTKIRARRSLVKGWLDLDSLAMLYGRPASGKSLLAIDIALHLATGSWWHGHKIRAGAVLYVVAEGAAGIADRQTAWAKHNKVYSDLDNLIWLPVAVNLLDPIAAAALARLAAELAPVLVVIDTLARSMPGGDENAGKDMGRVIDAADKIKAATGACVLVVHHSGKDQAAGARGWSGLLAAVDTELELKSAENILILSNTKQKDHADQLPTRFTLVPHKWTCPDCDGRGVDAAGEECDRCDGDKEIGHVAVAKYTGHVNLELEASGGKTERSYEALTSIDAGDGVSSGDWFVAADDAGVSRAAFSRHKKKLLELGRVKKIGNRYTAFVNETGAA